MCNAFIICVCHSGTDQCGSSLFKCVCNLVGMIFSVWLFSFLVDLFVCISMSILCWSWGRGVCLCYVWGWCFFLSFVLLSLFLFVAFRGLALDSWSISDVAHALRIISFLFCPFRLFWKYGQSCISMRDIVCQYRGTLIPLLKNWGIFRVVVGSRPTRKPITVV